MPQAALDPAAAGRSHACETLAHQLALRRIQPADPVLDRLDQALQAFAPSPLLGCLAVLLAQLAVVLAEAPEQLVELPRL